MNMQRLFAVSISESEYHLLLKNGYQELEILFEKNQIDIYISLNRNLWFGMIFVDEGGFSLFWKVYWCSWRYGFRDLHRSCG